MMEGIWLLRGEMVTRQQIEDFAAEIARRYAPEKIILFGSQARGTANEDSDVDLLVVMDFEGRNRDQAGAMRSTMQSQFPMDLIVRRRAELEWRIKENDFFLQDAVKEGIVLYESNHAGVA
jgi:predicted nucleotidyltransferase